MNEDFNPEAPRNLPSDALTKALEELIEGRTSRAEGPGAQFAEMPPDDLTEPCVAPGACPLPLGEGFGRAASSSAAQAPNLTNLDALSSHSADCPACAARLRLLFAGASPEEEAEAAALPSASFDWQRNLASRLASTPHRSEGRERGWTRPFYLWAGAGLAASLLLAAGLTGWWRIASTPERLLAEAYTQSRIFDLRMPGAGFAEVKPAMHLRGGAAGRESSRLLDARARIERHLESAPEDQHWLQLEARSDVLEERFDPAIDILDRLLATGPVTSSLLVDDAAAYFQRGVATGSENDRATALEYLSHADELAPGDPVVLFNEAVVMEDRGQVMNAVETWNRYLRFERDPRWLAEGRRRIEALEQKLNQLKSHQSRMEQHFATPQAMRSLAAIRVQEASRALIPRFHLEPFIGRPIEGLSHGTRQRIAIVSALLHDPEVFIVDEPMVGLDPQHARVVKDVLKERSLAGTTVLVSTHQLSIAEEMADRIGIILGGRLIAVGTRDEFRRQSGASGALEEIFLSLTADPK